MALIAVFLFSTALYIWRAADAQPLSLHGGQTNAYNQLADAFLHFRLWVAHFPASMLGPKPNNPATGPAFLYDTYWDTALHNGYIYLTWGPTPVLILLVPLHLLGYEPSNSVVIAPFAIAGLAFALAALRVILRQIGEVSLWLCILAALVLASASVVPYLLQSPSVYYQAVAGGYCFAMAGIWLALGATVERRVSRVHLGFASLCFGLAAGSRPPLALAALALVPVYLSLRPIRQNRSRLAALTLPFGACLILLAAYNEVRFGSPMEIGTKYQINTLYNAHWGELSYVPPGLWSYLLTPPRLNVLFPFLSIISAKASYPLSFSSQNAAYAEPTGGLLVLAPITVFLVALPWMWRRHPGLLGSLGTSLLLTAIAGLVIMLFLTYYFFSTTERYEVDYTTLLLFGALATWLALSTHARGRRRRLVRIGGGFLAVWSCTTGLAIAYQETNGAAGPRRALVNLGSPLSTALATVAGHAVLAEVSSSHVLTKVPEGYGNVGTSVMGFWMAPGEQVDMTIVSPDRRKVALAGQISAGPGLRQGAALEVRVLGPGHSDHSYRLPPETDEEVRIPVDLTQGINRLELLTFPWTTHATNSPVPVSHAVMVVSSLHLTGN